MYSLVPMYFAIPLTNALLAVQSIVAGCPSRNPLFLFYVGLKGRLSSNSVCLEKSKVDRHPNFDQKSARYQNIQGS